MWQGWGWGRCHSRGRESWLLLMPCWVLTLSALMRFQEEDGSAEHPGSSLLFLSWGRVLFFVQVSTWARPYAQHHRDFKCSVWSPGNSEIPNGKGQSLPEQQPCWVEAGHAQAQLLRLCKFWMGKHWGLFILMSLLFPRRSLGLERWVDLYSITQLDRATWRLGRRYSYLPSSEHLLWAWNLVTTQFINWNDGSLWTTVFFSRDHSNQDLKLLAHTSTRSEKHFPSMREHISCLQCVKTHGLKCFLPMLKPPKQEWRYSILSFEKRSYNIALVNLDIAVYSRLAWSDTCSHTPASSSQVLGLTDMNLVRTKIFQKEILRYWGQMYVNVGSTCVCACMCLQICVCLNVCQCACICMQRGHRSVMGIIPRELYLVFLWGRVFLWYLGLSIWLRVLLWSPGNPFIFTSPYLGLQL